MKTLILVLLFWLPLVSFSQNCTTLWPYLYNDFQQGKLSFSDGRETTELVNIHVLESKLHYLKDNLILETSDPLIKSVAIGGEIFMNVNETFVKIISQMDSVFLGVIRKGDFESLLNSGGAYGSSSNAQSIRKLSSIEVGGINSMNHMYLKENKENGKAISLNTEYCFVVDGRYVKASRKDVQAFLNTQGKDDSFKLFVKNNKINWKKEDSLVLVMNYLSGAIK